MRNINVVFCLVFRNHYETSFAKFFLYSLLLKAVHNSKACRDSLYN